MATTTNIRTTKATPTKATTKATTKAQPAKAAPTTASATKAQPAKAAPTKASATKAQPARATPTKATPHLDRIGLPGPVKGYTVRWPHASFDLAKKTDSNAVGAAWLVVCNAHGTHTTASNAKEGDVLGGKAGRPAWCKACAKADS
jgi:hypothetical protein